jgi:L-fuculose-phosphate aldolase
MDESKLKRDIVEVGKRLYNKGFVASNDGNISIRLPNDEVLITPTGVSKGYMSESDILKVSMSGEVISGHLKPTSEIKMHLAVYRKRPDVKAIVHAHPPKATAFAVAGIGFDKITLPEVVFSLGSIPLAEYGTPTTHEVPEAVEKHIVKSDALLLANHGALTVGTDVFDAYYKMETLEHFSSISLYARILGGERALNEEQTRELFRIRSKVYGKSDLVNCVSCGACDGMNRNSGENKGVNDSKVEAEAADSQEKSEEKIKEAIRKLVLAELKKLNL